MNTAIVVGSGAGGAAVAKELHRSFDVTILEAGREFYPFHLNMPFLEKIKKTGLLFDERAIRLFFPYMKIKKTEEGMILAYGIGLGGSTVLSTGNALRCDKDLKALGIDLDTEFDEIYREIPVSTGHRNKWSKATVQLYDITRELNLNPQPTPKMGNLNRCVNCGRCVLGCSYGAKWDSRKFLESAIENGANLITKCIVKKVVIKNGKATGVLARKGMTDHFFPADLVILAAGGLSTPGILQNSGIDCEQNLFVDPVLCVAMKYENCQQYKEIPMPFIVQKEHFILSPYFDYLSFFFNRGWKYPAKDIMGIMIKFADSNTGRVSDKKIDKMLAGQDKKRLSEGIEICTEILYRLGGKEHNTIFFGTMNAGHPGGMMPLTRKEAHSLHHDRLPDNLFIADASLLPNSLGNPPILTIIALAKRIGKICNKLF